MKKRLSVVQCISSFSNHTNDWFIFDNVHVNNANSRPCDGIHFLTNFMSTLLLPVNRCWFCLIVYSHQSGGGITGEHWLTNILFLLWSYVIAEIGKEEYINLIPFRIWTAKYFEPHKIPVACILYELFINLHIVDSTANSSFS